MSADDLISLTRELAGLRDEVLRGWKHEEAVRLILYDIWCANQSSAATCDLTKILDDSWAGSILMKMQEHHHRREGALHQHEERNDPEKVKLYREEKRRNRQTKHAERLQAKKKRDDAWRLRQLPDEGEK
ncbi:hypothetical protein [Xanthobacter autotrophicus]|uniref:hypothetical protein n=1 Tax=Xanthobacter autotrophicus TaxID=280 RepID=UPI003726F55C